MAYNYSTVLGDAARLSGSMDPTTLANNTGDGEVVYFGGPNGGLAEGALYYLKNDGNWASASAEATGSGHNQLLAISQGTNPNTDGMLTRGYFDVTTYYSGAFVQGGPIYVCSSSFGHDGFVSGGAPGTEMEASNAFVRVVGYGTTTANVVYFNPGSTYVEMA